MKLNRNINLLIIALVSHMQTKAGYASMKLKFLKGNLPQLRRRLNLEFKIYAIVMQVYVCVFVPTYIFIYPYLYLDSYR